MKNPNNKMESTKIRFQYDRNDKESIVKALDINPEIYANWAKKKHEIRKTAKDLLHEYAINGIISDFKEYSDWNGFAGFNISF